MAGQSEHIHHTYQLKKELPLGFSQFVREMWDGSVHKLQVSLTWTHAMEENPEKVWLTQEKHFMSLLSDFVSSFLQTVLSPSASFSFHYIWRLFFLHLACNKSLHLSLWFLPLLSLSHFDFLYIWVRRLNGSVPKHSLSAATLLPSVAPNQVTAAAVTGSPDGGGQAQRKGHLDWERGLKRREWDLTNVRYLNLDLCLRHVRGCWSEAPDLCYCEPYTFSRRRQS